MRKEILDNLIKITPEEKRLLHGLTGIDKTIYSKDNSSVVDAKVLLGQGKLIDIRPHTRFAHFPKHSHNYVEMVYMVSGSTRHLVNENEVVLKEGELLLMNQQASQEIFPAQKKDIAVNFMILPEFFDTTLTMIGNKRSMVREFLIDCLRSGSGHVDYLHFQVSQVLPIQNLMENLIYMLLNHTENRHQLNQTTMGLLFMHLAQHTDHVTVGGDRLEDEVMMKVLGLIEENYKDGQLSKLCDRLQMDLYSISRIVKRRTGQTYTDLLQKKRLGQAAFFLKNTKLSITDIALNVGYNNFSYFYKLFKKEYGLTPKEYRKQ
ncbi:MAG TPA: AraC family transcriptional regulator [Lachnospiraceae bacterium]